MSKDYGTLELTKGQFNFITQYLREPLPADKARIRNRICAIFDPISIELNAKIQPIFDKYYKRDEKNNPTFDEIGNPIWTDDKAIATEYNALMAEPVVLPIHASQLIEFKTLKEIMLGLKVPMDYQQTQVYEQLCTILEKHPKI